MSSKQRVVITGTGIVSCIGNDSASVTAALRAGRSGIRAMPEFAEMGLRSQVAGVPQIDLEAHIERKQLRFMGDAAAYAHIALAQAIAQAGLTPAEVSHPRTGLIMGSGAARRPTRSRLPTFCAARAYGAWGRTRSRAA
jgi:3-oxoacyl-(acyl-carrier-protein) synthase